MYTDPDNMAFIHRVDCYCFGIPSMFSFVGCTVVVLSILKMKKLQTLTFQLIGIQMIAEGLQNFTRSLFLYPPPDNTEICAIQFFVLAWTYNVNIILTSFMSYHMYHCIKRENSAGYRLTRRRLYITSAVVCLYSAISVAIPIIRNGYGREGSQCWLAPNNSHLEHSIFVMIVLYGPLWICILYSLYTYVAIYQYVRGVSRLTEAIVVSSQLPPRTASQTTEGVVLKLMYYPCIMILCWTGITIYRVVIIVRPDEPLPAMFLWISHVFLHVQGVLDTAVFFSYASVQSEYRLLYNRWFGGPDSAQLVVRNRKMSSEMTPTSRSPQNSTEVDQGSSNSDDVSE